jgi:metallo-beta-lactamase family protein
MELSFHGATGTTTGSCHRIRTGGHTLLLDCGMFQGRRDESRRLNEHFGFDAREIDAVVQSHAHIDHSGKLPMLARHGFRGSVFATSATRDLCEIMLHDSARILMQDAQFLNRERIRRALGEQRERERREDDAHGGGRHAHGRHAPARGARRAQPDSRSTGDAARNEPAWRIRRRNDTQRRVLPEAEIFPLFLDEDVDLILEQFEEREYGDWFEPVPNVRARFHDAGHILGSAWIELEIREGTETKRVVFTGDYGRKHQPILRDPEPLERADVFITESTYGNRMHPPHAELDAELGEAVKRLAQRGTGRLLIPAFAVGRTQHILYSLARLYREKRVPPVRVVVDSPLATAATQILVRHANCFDEEARLEHNLWLDGSELTRWLSFTSSVDDSKALNADPRPTIVISASGMMESGRILHHLAWHVHEESTEILIVGFQAEHTLGRRILDGMPRVRIYGLEYDVRARVTPLLGFSAHADRGDLLAALEGHQPGAQAVFLVHGEDDQRRPLGVTLRERGFARVEEPSDARVWTF